MEQPLGENSAHMIVIQGVIHRLAVPPVFDQPGLPQGSKLVGNGGFGHPQQGGNIADAHFMALERAEYFYPGRIAENLEQIRQIEQNFLIRHGFPGLGNGFFVDDVTIAFVNYGGPARHYRLLKATIEYMLNYKISWYK
jgi:hypothetical protein